MRLIDIVRGWLGLTPPPPPAPPPPPPPPVVVVPPPPPGPAPVPDRVRVVFDLQNKTRLAYGLPVLAWDPRLAAAAQRFAEEMGKRGVLSHTGIGGSTVGTRVRDAGYYWTMCGENIAMGQPTAEAVVKAWFNSPGHRANMLKREYAHCGVGAYTDARGRVWWCVDFARPQTGAFGPVVHCDPEVFLSGPLCAEDVA